MNDKYNHHDGEKVRQMKEMLGHCRRSRNLHIGAVDNASSSMFCAGGWCEEVGTGLEVSSCHRHASGGSSSVVGTNDIVRCPLPS